MRRAAAAVLAAIIMLSVSGCALFSGNYASEKLHHSSNQSGQSGQQIASSYPEIVTSLASLIAQGESSGVIILTELSEQVAVSYMQAAVKNLMQQDPIAAYAVENIKYDLGTNAGRIALAVQIDYSRSRADIAAIKSVKDLDEAELLIGQSLEQAVDTVVFCVDEYDQMDFSSIVRNYAETNAHMAMEVPQVMTAVYPHTGKSRLVELKFTYQNSQEDLLNMQALVRPVFMAAELYVQGESSVRTKFQQLHSFLMERSDYQLRNAVTPAYSLLMDGIGDSKAFACVYAAMCRQAGLECRVINGSRNGEEWSWNRVVINNRVYYIDLIESERYGRLQFHTASEMAGYTWER